MFHPADAQLGCYLPQVGTPAAPLPCAPHSYRGHTGQTRGTAGQPPVPLHLQPELRPPPRTYLDSRLGHLRGRKNRKTTNRAKVRTNLLEPGRGKAPAGKAPGAGGAGPWMEGAACGCRGGRARGERGRSPSRPWQGGGDWRKAGGRAAQHGVPAAP